MIRQQRQDGYVGDWATQPVSRWLSADGERRFLGMVNARLGRGAEALEWDAHLAVALRGAVGGGDESSFDAPSEALQQAATAAAWRVTETSKMGARLRAMRERSCAQALAPRPALGAQRSSESELQAHVPTSHHFAKFLERQAQL